MTKQNKFSEDYTTEVQNFSQKQIDNHPHNQSENTVAKILSRGMVCSDLTFSNPEKKNLDILFLGLNPSYIGDDYKKFDEYDPTSRETYPRYFGAFHRLVEKLEGTVNWTQMDILNVRETKSQKVLNLINYSVGLKALVENLKITFNQIEKLKPRLVIVCNTKAAKFTGIEAFPTETPNGDIWMGYKFEFDDNLGVHRITGLHADSIAHVRDESDKILERVETKLMDTPLFFTSTLTYMSKYVQESLAWQIGRVLKK
ncbi:MAG: hypothetical protein WBA74_26670 [Cyclobacteriaceae bacterium]